MLIIRAAHSQPTHILMYQIIGILCHDTSAHNTKIQATNETHHQPRSSSRHMSTVQAGLWASSGACQARPHRRRRSASPQPRARRPAGRSACPWSATSHPRWNGADTNRTRRSTTTRSGSTAAVRHPSTFFVTCTLFESSPNFFKLGSE